MSVSANQILEQQFRNPEKAGFPLTMWLSVSFYMEELFSLPFSQVHFIRPETPIQLYNNHSTDQNSQHTLYQNRESRLLRENLFLFFWLVQRQYLFPWEQSNFFLTGTFCRNTELESGLKHEKFQHPGPVSGTLLTLWHVVRTYRVQLPVPNTV